MPKRVYIVLIYGAVVLLGGIIGYVSAQSLMSLMMGALFGVALLASGFAMNRGMSNGYYASLILTGLLTLFFHYRYLKTGVFIPTGMLAVVSALVLVSLLILRGNGSKG